MRKGYLIVEARVEDSEAYEVYKALAEKAVTLYGGRYLVRGGPIEMLEGKWSEPGRLVIIEFDSLTQVRCFYESPEYQQARASRAGAAIMNMLVVEGVPFAASAD